jgi:hypothetical protein
VTYFPFDEERIVRALEAKGRPFTAALTRGVPPIDPAILNKLLPMHEQKAESE